MSLRRAIARRVLGDWYEDPTPPSDNAIILPEPPWRQRVRGLFLWYRHWRHVHPHYPRRDSARRAWVYRSWPWKPDARKHWVTPMPGRLWAIRRMIALRLRMFGNLVDQGDSLWIDDYFTNKQRQKYEDLRDRYNDLRERMIACMSTSAPLDSTSLSIVPMRNYSPDPDAEPEGEPWSVLCVYLNELLREFPPEVIRTSKERHLSAA